MNYKDDDIVVSSRVRLARNLADTPFLPGMTRKDADAVIARAAEAAPELMLVKAGELSPIERQVSSTSRASVIAPAISAMTRGMSLPRYCSSSMP